MTSSLPKLLLTGAEGQLGMALQHHPMKNNFQLQACSRNQLNITDQHSIETALCHYQPNLVINSAAYTAVDKAEQDAANCLQVNHLGARLLAEACAKKNIPLLHLSTDYVFAGDSHTPYLEEDPVSPVNLYGESKWLGEEAIRATLDKHIILRVSGVFSIYGTNFMKTMRRLAQEKKELRVVANQIICPTYANDIATAIFTIASRLTHWGTYHYCNTPPVSWHQFASAIIQHAATKQKVLVEQIHAIDVRDYPTPAKRPAYSVLQCDKIARDYQLSQRHWKEGIMDAFA